MNNIQKVNKVHPNGWCVKSFPKVVSDLNKIFEYKWKGSNVYYGILSNYIYTNNTPFNTLITEQEYLAIVGDVDYGGVRFRFCNGDDKIYTLIKNNDGKYTFGLGGYFYPKCYIVDQFTCGEWIKIPEPIVEIIPEKTLLELIEERLTALEAAQVKPVVTEDWENVACLSYNDILGVATNCCRNIFSTGSNPDLKILKNTIKQKLSI